jgi:hypothetical protein
MSCDLPPTSKEIGQQEHDIFGFMHSQLQQLLLLDELLLDELLLDELLLDELLLPLEDDPCCPLLEELVHTEHSSCPKNGPYQ